MPPSASVAISIPIGGWHPFLPTVLESLSHQGVSIELAILDASDDHRVAAAVEAADLPLTYHRVGRDGGQTEAIDEGWRNTRSPFVTWLNADDILMPGALGALVAALEKNKADVAFGESTILDQRGATIGLHGQVADVDDLLYRSNCISQPSALVRRAAVDAIGGLDTSLHYTMDWDLWQRLYANKARFHRLDGVYSAVFWGDGTKTSKIIPQRLGELFRQTARYAGHFAAAKTVLSAALQTKSLTRQLLNTDSGLFFAADGNPREPGKQTLVVPVMNASLSPAMSLIVEWEGSRPNIEAMPHTIDYSLGEEIAVINLKAGIAPGQTIALAVNAPKDGRTRLVRLCLRE